MYRYLIIIMLLAACGGEEQYDRTCLELPQSINTDSLCLATFECSPGEPQFRGHMCLCCEKSCLCLVSRSTKPCDAPEDEACETESSILITSPDLCKDDAVDRDSFLSGEYNRIFNWEKDK